VVASVGEMLRLWAVRHIGVISRTRSDRLGPLVASGPFGIVRNPLYIGNVLLWLGLTVSARLLWLAPVVTLVLVLQYRAIVAWEEHVLARRLGDAYRQYAAHVPRWIPRAGRTVRGGTTRGSGENMAPRFSWKDALFSERGTLAAIAAGYVLLWAKDRF
jgi:protein-S-isoprenylcysteine O-methyltransferase Ste14